MNQFNDIQLTMFFRSVRSGLYKKRVFYKRNKIISNYAGTKLFFLTQKKLKFFVNRNKKNIYLLLIKKSLNINKSLRSRFLVYIAYIFKYINTFLDADQNE